MWAEVTTADAADPSAEPGSPWREPAVGLGQAGAVSEAASLPPGLKHVRTTPEFTVDTVPPGLLAAHRVAAGVWGRLRVVAGKVTFVVEDTGERRQLAEGDVQVIEPEVAHHVELAPGARFAVEFHR